MIVFSDTLLIFLSKKEANKSAGAREESELCVDCGEVNWGVG